MGVCEESITSIKASPLYTSPPNELIISLIGSTICFLDITEIEIEDQTGSKVKMPDETEKYPTYTGYKYRSMKTMAPTGGMNAIWFIYDITPVEIHYNVFYRPWGDFLVHLCAIVGGIFAAVGLFETLLSTGLCLAVPSDPKKVEGR